MRIATIRTASLKPFFFVCLLLLAGLVMSTGCKMRSTGGELQLFEPEAQLPAASETPTASCIEAGASCGADLAKSGKLKAGQLQFGEEIVPQAAPAVAATECCEGLACRDGTCQVPPSCGNGKCDADENCRSCSQDCGPCHGQCQDMPDGTLCDDKNPCTRSDKCWHNACQGIPYSCVEALSCRPGVCNGDGSCTYTLAVDKCLIAGKCYDEGAQQTGCMECRPTTSQTDWSAKPDGMACDDGSACTQTDACKAGTCVGSNPKACAALDQCHDAGVCNPTTGACSNPAKPNDPATACDDGRDCTHGDRCVNGSCTPTSQDCECTAATVATDCKTDDCHTVACVNEYCVETWKAAGAVCDDKNPCTAGDTCRDPGLNNFTLVCRGDPKACTALDQCHDAGTCDVGTGLCSNPPKADGTACDDHDKCTQTDTCVGGACAGANHVVCTALDNCHIIGTCNPQTGTCSNPFQPDGTACVSQFAQDNGLASCMTEACMSGVCQLASACVGSPAGGFCIGSNACTGGSCMPANSCECGPQPDGTVKTCAEVPCQKTVSCEQGRCAYVADDTLSCSDGNACTRTDACQGGVCVGSNPVACTALDDCHVAGTCDAATGVCDDPARPDGTECHAGERTCMVNTCIAGACIHDAAGCACNKDEDCNTSPPAECHLPTTCDVNTGTCNDPPHVPNPAPLGSIAAKKAAIPGGGTSAKPVSCGTGTCGDGEICFEGECVADATNCSDDNACTGTDLCMNGACVGANPVVCTASDQCHDAGTCDPATGACSNPQAPDGTACDDGSACTQSDACYAGACMGANPILCPPSDQCHDAGTCDPATGACSNPPKANGAACNDGNACTQTDTCLAGACAGGNPVVCPPSDQCHDAGTCDPATGACSNPPKADGAACSDGNACTQADACQAGVCVGGGLLACPPPDACHGAGTCSPATGACGDYPVAANGCIIGGACYANGALNPNNPCQQCDISQNLSGWSPNPAGTAADGTYCCATLADCPARPLQPACLYYSACSSDNTCVGLRGCNAAEVGCYAPGARDPSSPECGWICDPAGSGTYLYPGDPGGITNGTACTLPPMLQLPCRVAQCQNGFCGVDAPNGTACDDGDPCTSGDACQAGVCGSGTRIYTGSCCLAANSSCTDSSQCCTGLVCPPFGAAAPTCTTAAPPPWNGEKRQSPNVGGGGMTAFIARDAAGYLYVPANVSGQAPTLFKFDAGGQPVWPKSTADKRPMTGMSRVESIAYSAAHDCLYVTGSDSSNRPALLRLTTDGRPPSTWTQPVPISDQSGSGYDVTVAADGIVYVTGSANGGHAFLASYDLDGHSVNPFRDISATASSRGTGITTDGDGNIYVAGNTYGDIEGGAGQYRAGAEQEAFLIKFGRSLNGSLSVLFARIFGASDPIQAYDDASSIAVDANKNIYVGGNTTGSIGGGRMGGENVYLAEYDSSGVLKWAKEYYGTLSYEGYQGVEIGVDATGNVYATGFAKGGTVAMCGAAVEQCMYLFQPNTQSGDLLKAATYYSLRSGTPVGFTFGSINPVGLIVDPAGNIYLDSSQYGVYWWNPPDIVVVKYDSNLILQ